MLSWSRRQALRTAAAAGAFALAGCSGEASRSNAVPGFRERITDYAVTASRNDDGDPLFVSTDEPTADGDGSARVRELHLLTEAADLESLSFREAAGTGGLRTFVTETDFESATVYLVQRPIGRCYVPRLDGVYREGDGIDATFCREPRSADFDCDVDDRDMVAVAIRVPLADDGFNSVGFSPWGHDCRDGHAAALTEAP